MEVFLSSLRPVLWCFHPPIPAVSTVAPYVAIIIIPMHPLTAHTLTFRATMDKAVTTPTLRALVVYLIFWQFQHQGSFR